MFKECQRMTVWDAVIVEGLGNTRGSKANLILLLCVIKWMAHHLLNSILCKISQVEGRGLY